MMNCQYCSGAETGDWMLDSAHYLRWCLHLQKSLSPPAMVALGHGQVGSVLAWEGAVC